MKWAKWLSFGLIIAAILVTYRHSFTTGENDFKGRFQAAEKVWKSNIYAPGTQTMRLPWYAAALSPFTKLPYQKAYWAFQALNAAALVGFLLLWPEALRWFELVLFSLPLWCGFLAGHDLPFMLLGLALSERLRAKNQDLASGLALSLGMGGCPDRS